MGDSLSNAWTNYGPLSSIFTPPPACNYLTISYTTPLPITTTETLHFPTQTTLPRLIFYDPIVAPTCFPTQYPTRQIQKTITTTITFEETTTTSTIYPTTKRGYFYPGRCPSGWEVLKLSYSFVPADHTLAVCCPSFPIQTPSSNHPRDLLENRRGSNPKKSYSSCNFALPTLTLTNTPTITSGNSATNFASITALANGSLTTMGAREWLGIGGSISGKTVWATGINVMWKRGDFPDLDEKADEAAALASASNAAYWGQVDHSHDGLTNGAKIAIGTCIPVVLILVGVFLFSMKRMYMHKRGDSVTAAITRRLKKRFAAEGEGKAENLLLVKKGNIVGATSVLRGSSASSAAREDYIESMSNQPPVTEKPTGKVDDTPPPYTQSGGCSTSTATSTGNTRMWNETNLEYDQRRLKERKELLLERIRLAREEDDLRARMRDEAP